MCTSDLNHSFNPSTHPTPSYLSCGVLICVITLGISVLDLSLDLSRPAALLSAYAAPDDRGQMGPMIALGGGGYMGYASDEDGADTGSQLGQSFQISLGEEVLPKVFLGLGFDAHLGSTQNGLYDAQLFSFGLEGRYRLIGQSRGLVLIGGLGVGGGGVSLIKGKESSQKTSKDSSGGSSGGSVWKLGLGYELGLSSNPKGVTFSPRLIYQRLRPQMESLVSVDVVTLNLEIMWSFGRTLSPKS